MTLAIAHQEDGLVGDRQAGREVRAAVLSQAFAVAEFARRPEELMATARSPSSSAIASGL